jgi:hypothetical protein
MAKRYQRSNQIYRFWLLLWYLQILLVIIWLILKATIQTIQENQLEKWSLIWPCMVDIYRASEAWFDRTWWIYIEPVKLSLIVLQILITPLVSCGHCVVCHSLIDRFWLLLWYLWFTCSFVDISINEFGVLSDFDSIISWLREAWFDRTWWIYIEPEKSVAMFWSRLSMFCCSR